MSIIDCSALIEPHFHWPSYPFVSQDPARGDEFQEYGLKWCGPGFSHVTAPGWQQQGANRLDDFSLNKFASLADVIDVSDLTEVNSIELAKRLPGNRNEHSHILVLKTCHPSRVQNRHIRYWSEAPVFEAECVDHIVEKGYSHVVIDVPCDDLLPRRPLDDGYVSNRNGHFRRALHQAGLLLTENAENLNALEQSQVFFVSLPLSLTRSALSPVRPIAYTEWPSDNPELFDVSTPMFNHWRWFIDIDEGLSMARGDLHNEAHFTIRGHGFTHCDAPRHMRRDGLTMQELPNQGLDLFSGEASIIDLADLPLPTPITTELLQQRATHVRENDLIVLRSDLTNRVGYESLEWHKLSPNLETSAAEWLLSHSPKALVLDFPQDYVAREMPTRHVRVEEFHTHLAVFGRNVPFVEDLRDIGQIDSNRTYLLAVPLKTTCIDGALMRAIFIRW